MAVPNRNTKAGGFKDSVHPINAEVREAVERIIFGAYRFCLDNNYGNVQFDVLTEFHATLLEESFSDFQLVNKETINLWRHIMRIKWKKMQRTPQISHRKTMLS